MRTICAAAAVSILLANAVPALAANSCTASATSMVFGAYMPGNGPLYSTASVKVACTSGAFFGVGAATGYSNSYSQRLMSGAYGTLQYNVYTTAGYSSIWGDGTGATAIYAGTGTGTSSPLTFTAYGLLPDSAANQAADPGTYTDSLLVVISF